MVYKLFTSLNITDCEKKLRDTIKENMLPSSADRIKCFGKLDIKKRNFWIMNKFRKNNCDKRKYNLPSLGKFVGELHPSEDGTKIVGQFESFRISKVFLGIWYMAIIFSLTLCIYRGVLDFVVNDNINTSLIKICLAIITLCIIGWIVFKLSISRRKKVEEHTMEFLINLLQVDEIETELEENIVAFSSLNEGLE
ncbi:hypothetical protein [Sporosalibacterium faouarense]|uniref:hypothetical protein n=1 Tax=Sporosalibacterium faouarense TaxID=516123 RepID=UPI00141CBFEA|nr:hypothetical protein [Sporosalibacterium faouarense]MTI47845.1 hypothetical protein [Bacillota bacterium]